MNSLQGGKFGHGFVSAGVAQAASGMIDGIDPSNVAIRLVELSQRQC